MLTKAELCCIIFFDCNKKESAMFGHVKIQRDSDDHIIKVFKQSNMEIWTPFGSPMIPQWSPFSFGVLKIRKHKTDQILGNVNSWKSILPEPVRFNRPNYTAPRHTDLRR